MLDDVDDDDDDDDDDDALIPSEPPPKNQKNQEKPKKSLKVITSLLQIPLCWLVRIFEFRTQKKKKFSHRAGSRKPGEIIRPSVPAAAAAASVCRVTCRMSHAEFQVR